MKKFAVNLFIITIISLLIANKVFVQTVDELKINPLQFISLKEVRNITNTLGNELFPGYDFTKMPSLFYRPKVQELLINYPHKPAGFSMYKGFNPLSDEMIYARNDSTVFTIDDQNTSTQIEGIDVLVVADYFSGMRNKIGDIVRNRDKEFISTWLDEWSFIPSPYNEIRTMLHEGIHVYQTQKAPDKFANESVVSAYPLLDPINNSLYVLEGNILRDAILTESPAVKREKINEFVAIRTYRQSLLKKEMVEYENLNEYVEGLAKYIEYKFLNVGEKVQPIKEMYYENGFKGYKGVLSAIFKDEIEDMVKIVSVSDNRFGNKYGTGPMRFRLYFSGACQALLLDYVMPEWKTKIFNDGVYLCDLLKSSVKLSEQEIKEYTEKAKNNYNYNQIYNEKKDFETDGKNKIQEKLNAILDTKNTLITISYSKYPEIKGMSYTPFGVTQVSEKSAIYDMVPVIVLFDKNKKLTMKKIIPVYIDEKKNEITFEVKTPASDLELLSGSILETDEFILSNMDFEIKKENSHVFIQLK